jgi:hypothetical protein
MKKFSFKVGVYDLMCHVIIADDIEKIYNKLAKKNGWNQLSDDTEAGGLAIGGDLFNYYIFYKTNSLTPGILAHEASHIVDEILQNRGIELVGEARAYLTQHITDKIYDKVLKYKLLVHKYLNLNFNEKIKEDEKPASGLPSEVNQTSTGNS